MRLHLRRLGGIAFIVVAFAFLGLALYRERQALVAFEWHVRPLRLVASFLLLVVALVASPAIWGRTLRCFDAHVRFRDLARIWFLSSLGRYIPGKIWQFVGVAELGRAASLPAAVGVTSIAAYMGFTVVAAVFVGVYLFPPSLAGAVRPAWTGAALGAPLLLVALHPRLLNRLVGLAARLTRRPALEWRGSWGSALGITLLSGLQWLVFGAAFFVFVSSLTEIAARHLPTLTAVFALAFLAGYLVVVAPAGLGVKEGAMAVLLSTMLPLPVSAALAVATRVWSILGEVLPALVLLPVRRDAPRVVGGGGVG